MIRRSDVMRDGLRWLFVDRTTGRIVVAQAPNILLWIVIGSWLARHAVRADTPIALLFAWVGCVTLGLWGLDELTSGVNPWRRVLGMVAVAFAIMTHP